MSDLPGIMSNSNNNIKTGKTKTGDEKSAASEWMKNFIQPEKKTLKNAAVLDLFASVTGIVQAACIAVGFAELLSEESPWSVIIVPAGLYLVLAVFRSAIEYFAGRMSYGASKRLRTRLREALVHRCCQISPLDISARPIGEIASLGSEIVDGFEAYLSRYVSVQNRVTYLPLVIVVTVGYFSWFVALVLLLCGIFIPVVMALAGMCVKKDSDRQIEALAWMSARFLDRLQGMTTLRLFDAVKTSRTELSHIADDYRVATMRVLKTVFLSSAALEFFSAGGIAGTAIYVALSWGGYLSFGAWGLDIGIASGLFLLLVAPDFFAPLKEFSAIYHDRASANSAAKKLMGLVDWKSDTSENPVVSTQRKIDLTKPIQFRNVTLTYPGKSIPALENLSFSIARDGLVAITGPSGCGKSTILACLSGLLPPNSGSILIGDVMIDHTTREVPGDNMGWIAQTPHIFHGTVLANVRLANPSASRVEVYEALRLAHLDTVVRQLPRQELTVLGETGFGLSGGQLRRLAIARAILSGKETLLIDEPTADLDTDTAKEVRNTLIELSRSRRLIIATHDPELVRLCAHVIELDKSTKTQASEITEGTS
ncbi:MAG: thiol reductant ABC exporter subunit CydD [Cohaesibacteraceae bacterium]|nr:thiol reductant ABC exporter subunit CydD [Cohaesibacteraceae bacterium]